MNKKTISPVVIIAVLVALLCCSGMIGIGVIVFSVEQMLDNVSVDQILGAVNTDTTTPIAQVTRVPEGEVPVDTLSLLEQTMVPNSNVYEITCRFLGNCNIPNTLEAPPITRQAGEQDTFWVVNVTTNLHFEIDATLRYVSDNAYFWIHNDVQYDERDLKALADAFETQILPTNRAFFGTEWSPGVDGDTRIYILYAKGLGLGLAGYYSSADQYHPLVHEYSNGHEMFLLSADSLDLGEEYTYSVLAHEYQHMIHWYLDRNEQSWLNEGFSELASFINGYNAGGFDWHFLSNPDLQLNDWPNDPNATLPHYGSGFLFTTYFLGRFGESATQALAANPLNGLESVDATLQDIGAIDELTGQPITADSFFMDWVLTNYVADPSLVDGRYAFSNYPGTPTARATEHIHNCPTGVQERTVHQYGADYISIACRGAFTLTFEGSQVVRLLPVDPYSGKYAFWSNKGDESNMMLTREFDLSNVSGAVTLSYQTWFDIEKDYDYVFVVASTDGERWTILHTPSGTAEDPSGNSYGWAYNGKTNGWIREQVDLSPYAGQKVFIRFEYITDAAVNGEGFLLDDVTISEIGYFEDFENGNGGWIANGFVRIQNLLPQTFQVALIVNGKQTTIENLSLTPDQRLEIPLSIGSDIDQVVLVVTGATRFTREVASYRFEIE